MKIYNKNKKRKEDIHKRDYSKVKIDLKDQLMKDFKLLIIQNNLKVHLIKIIKKMITIHQ